MRGWHDRAVGGGGRGEVRDATAGGGVVGGGEQIKWSVFRTRLCLKYSAARHHNQGWSNSNEEIMSRVLTQDRLRFVMIYLSSAGDGDVLRTTSTRPVRELQKPANDRRQFNSHQKTLTMMILWYNKNNSTYRTYEVTKGILRWWRRI